MEARRPRLDSSTRGALLVWCIIVICIISAVDGSGRSPSPFLLSPSARKGSANFFLTVRGGSDIDEYDDRSDSDGYEQEESEEEDSGDADEYESDLEDVEDTLSRSTRSAATKIQRKKSHLSKAAINASLQTKKHRKSVTKKLKLRIPYIIRVCFHPITVISMTRAYFSSLFNISYLEQEKSQGLRSALEAKAKRDAPSGGNKRGKRAMRPGQAKTLSDLPQLSA